MIKAIIFDMGGVIFSRAPSGVEKSIQPLINRSEQEIIAELKKAEFKDFLHGKISESQYWTSVIKRAGWKTDADSLKEAIRKHMKPVEGMMDLIKNLRNKKYNLFILSGNTLEWTRYLDEKYDYKRYFSGEIYSFQTGYNKPDMRIYRDILKKTGLTPEECLFIDDKPEFLEPAKNLGMKTILFKNPEQLKKDLLQNLIIL